jgi:putative glutamine amidotransferase
MLGVDGETSAMKKIGLSVSYPRFPENPTDIARIEKYLALTTGFDAQIEPLYLDGWEARALEVASTFDGLILAGGADLPPDWYGEEPLEGAGLDVVSTRRPNFEKQVVNDFIDARKPVLGICYGQQFLNVALGGSLFQDLVLQTGTELQHTDGFMHSVKLTRESLLYEIIGEEEFLVPSFHHQAIKAVAPDALASAFAEDGTIEAVEWADKPFFLGVQWHPERALGSNATQQLMRAFLAAK